MTENEKKLIKQLNGMVESYNIAMDVLKDSVAGGVVRGAFISQLKNARKLLDDIENNTK